MEGTQRQLALQPDAGSACQLVVWFTDGAIDLKGGDQATANALNDLCGQPIDPSGHAPTQGYGLFSAFRQSGVVVMGTLLAHGATRDAAEVMWPLVEGSGDVDGTPAAVRSARSAVLGACTARSSTPPIPVRSRASSSSSPARSPAATRSPSTREGRFWIDPGVTRFQIALGDGDWSLTAPARIGCRHAHGGFARSRRRHVIRRGDARRSADRRPGAAGAVAARRRTTSTTSTCSATSASSSTSRTRSSWAPTAGRRRRSRLRCRMPPAIPRPLAEYGTADFTASIVGPTERRSSSPRRTSTSRRARSRFRCRADVSAAEIVVTASLDPHDRAARARARAGDDAAGGEDRAAGELPADAHDPGPAVGARGRGRRGARRRSPWTGRSPAATARCASPRIPTVVSDSANRAAGWAWELERRPRRRRMPRRGPGRDRRAHQAEPRRTTPRRTAWCARACRWSFVSSDG